MEILLTILVMALVAFTIMKKMYPTMILLTIGIIILFTITLVNGQSVMGENSVGNIYLDIAEFVRTKFISTFGSQGIVLMPVFGYAAYMMHIGASKQLASLLIKPFAKAKSPYFLVIVAVVIAGLLRVAIPAQTGLISLLMVTIYPVMLESGMSKLSAGAACVLGSTFDWGPADITTALVLENTTKELPSTYFVAHQLPIFTIGLIVAAIVLCFVNKQADKKAGFILGSDNIVPTTENYDKLPIFYSILPIIPLIAMIIASPVVLGNVTISAFGAVLISFFLAIICEAIRKKSLLKSFSDSREMFKGMGACFANMITLLSAAAVFGDSLTMIGGFDKISNWINNASMPAILFILLICGITILMTFFVASTVPATTAFSPLIPGIAKSAGFAAETVMLPIGFTMGMSRAFSPISAPNIFVAEFLKVNAIDLIKRNVIPMLSAIVAILITSLIFMH